jgi:hypothetical protein
MEHGERSSGGRLLKQDQVTLGQTAARVPAGQLPRPTRPPAEPHGEPEVHLTRADDGTVIQITVRCPCGRETTLQCQYPDQGETDGNETA